MIWPPSKPTSTRTRSATRYQLRQHAVRRMWVNEGDLEPEEAFVRLLVDQLDALLRQPPELPPQIADLVGDVVHSGAPVRHELADRRFFAERAEELDTAAADAHRRRLDALRRNRLTVLELGAEHGPVGLDG